MEVSSWEHIYTWRIFQQAMSDFQRVSSPLVPVPGLKEIFGLDLGNSLFRHLAMVFNGKLLKNHFCSTLFNAGDLS
jgi:hypothetical protein